MTCKAGLTNIDANCDCISGYYYDTVSSNCAICDSKCTSCVNNATNCLACTDTSLSAPSCTSCAGRCKTCNPATPNVCTACADGLTNIDSSPTCQCVAGYYDTSSGNSTCA